MLINYPGLNVYKISCILDTIKYIRVGVYGWVYYPNHIVIHMFFVVIPICVGVWVGGISPRIAWDALRIDYSRMGGGLGGWDDNKAYNAKRGLIAPLYF